MAKAENMQTFALNLDRDHLHEVKKAALDSRMSASDWIREAIAEKMSDGVTEDSRLAGIVGAYRGLNEDGRAWLAQCADIAAAGKGLRA